MYEWTLQRIQWSAAAMQRWLATVWQDALSAQQREHDRAAAEWAKTDGSAGRVHAGGQVIRFVRKCQKPSAHASLVFAARSCNWQLALIFIVVVLPWLPSVPLLPKAFIQDVLLAGWLLAAIVWLLLVWRKHLGLRALPLDSVVCERLQCVGLPRQLLRHGEFVDALFEPMLFRANTVVFPNGVSRAVLIGFAIVFAAVIFAATGWANLVDRYPMKLWAAFLAAWVVCSFLFPTYFRVTPGRLEVLQFANLFGGKPSRRVFGLRKLPITVDLRRGICFIDAAEFPIALMRDRERFAYYLFLAAISTHVAPELPEDQLVG